jgi:hypothetical protein
MSRVPVGELEAGMVLAKPIVNENGIALVGEGSELTDALIERIQNMQIHTVSIIGAGKRTGSKEEAIEELEKRFRTVGDNVHMNTLKRILREHIAGLYE